MLRYMKDGTLLFGSGLFILGIYMIKSSLAWGVYGTDDLGPGFFPLVYGIVIIVFSAVLLIQTVRTLRVTQAVSEENPDRAGSIAALAAWLALMVSVPLMSFLGFVVGFGLALFFIIRVVFQRPTLNAAITASAIVLGLYFSFSVLLDLTLPTAKYWSF